MPCVIVLGGYGTGATVVAELLHSGLGVCMGPRKRYMEDWRLKNYLREGYHGRCIRKSIDYIIDREGSTMRWGYKDPRLCHMLNRFVELLEDTATRHQLIHVTRDTDATAKALAGYLGAEEWKPLRHMAEYEQKLVEQQLDAYVGKVFTLPYEKIVDQVDEIREWLP